MPLRGNIRQSVCRWCYRDLPLDALCRAAREIGLASVELLDPADWPVVRQHGLTCALANSPGPIPDGFNRRENHAQLVPAFLERIAAAAAAGVPNIVCFSGNRRGQSDAEGLAHCADGLRQLVGAAERAGVTLCVELLNSRIDHPDYQCDRTAWGVELIERVGSPRCRLLFDIYHMRAMGEDVVRAIREHHRYIAHYHTAGFPGRHEIDATQELDYPAIMRVIRETGYTGFVGQEFIPVGEPLAALRSAAQLCDV
ncbi:MAG: TIM barrel protein [Opitutae bacterium]|nr:TIM barrel protein [Opitutae bacterium]